jgi:hypothetical protein
MKASPTGTVAAVTATYRRYSYDYYYYYCYYRCYLKYVPTLILLTQPQLWVLTPHLPLIYGF